MADCNGVPFFRLLLSAERFNERAIFLGSFDLNMLDSRSSALLVRVTRPDHLRGLFFAAFFFAAFFLVAFFFTGIKNMFHITGCNTVYNKCKICSRPGLCTRPALSLFHEHSYINDFQRVICRAGEQAAIIPVTGTMAWTIP